MLVRDKRWEEIRRAFTESEKEQLREAVCGQAICPAGWIIDEDRLSLELRLKLRAALGLAATA